MEKSTFLTPNVIYHKFRTAIDRNIQYVKERITHTRLVQNLILDKTHGPPVAATAAVHIDFIRIEVEEPRDV